MVLDPPEGTRSLFSPSTRYAQIRRVIAQRLHLVGPLRQRALRVPLGLHHPVWVDDPDFELDDHLSRASLPSPGGRAELDAFVAAAMSRPLDPDRPLWEMYVVEGLAGGSHRADRQGASRHPRRGQRGLHVGRLSRPQSPGRASWPRRSERWDPDPLPGSARMLRYAASSLSHQPARVLATLDAGVEAIADLGHAQPGAAAAAARVVATRLLLGPADVDQRRGVQSQALLVPVDPARVTPSSSAASSGAR